MKKAVLIISIIAIIGVILWFVYKYTSLPKTIGLKSDNAYNSAGGLLVDYGDNIDSNKILIKGDKGNSVTRLQTTINELIDKYGYNYTKLSVDGIFGDKTEQAIKFVSANTLGSGTVTINKVANLPKNTSIIPATIAAPTQTYTPIAARPIQKQSNPYSRYMNA